MNFVFVQSQINLNYALIGLLADQAGSISFHQFTIEAMAEVVAGSHYDVCISLLAVWTLHDVSSLGLGP